jgi:N-acetylmuramoyl-L-alanine amidase
MTFPLISLGTMARSIALARLVLLSAGAVLLAAADMAPVTDDILAPMSPAERAAAEIVLAETTPREIMPPDAGTAAASLAAGDDVVARPANLALLVSEMTLAETDAADREQRCMAEAVYFESRGEPLEGQLAVAQAILNRVESGRFASTVCGVIRQPGQFSFNPNAGRYGRDWTTAQAIAAIAMRDLWHEVAPKAMSFHAVRVSPGWRDRTRVATIGRHVFYR